MAITTKDIDNWFTYHAPSEGQAERYVALREQAKVLAKTIIGCTKPCADQTASIRKLREAVMTANAAIACEET